MTTRRTFTTAIACAAALAALGPCHAQSKADAKPLARYIPATDLVVYVEFHGIDAHAAAWKKSALYKVLNETKLGAMIEELGTQLLDAAIASGPEKGRPKTADLTGVLNAVVKDGFVWGLVGRPPQAPFSVLAARNGRKNGFADFVTSMAPTNANSERRGSRSVSVESGGPASLAWWAEGDDFVMISFAKQGFDPVVAAIEGKAPSAATHAIRNSLAKAEPGMDSLLLAFIDFAKIPIPDTAKMGLDSLKRIDYRVGFDDDALCTILRVVAPAPRRGILAVLEQPTFTKDSLPPIPAGLTSWTVFSFSPASFYQKYKAFVLENAPPGAAPPMDAFEQGMQQTLGIRFKEDLLAQLGPKWVFYLNGEEPKEGQPMGKIRAGLSAEVRDPAAFGKTLDKVMAVVTQVVQGQAARNPQARMPDFRKVEGPMPGYRLVLPPGTMPPNVEGIIDPTLLIGKSQLVLGLNGDEARMAAAAEKRWTPGPDYTVPFSKLPGNLMALSVEDPRAVIPPLVAAAPALVAMANAMLANQPAPAGRAQLQLHLDPANVPTAEEVSRRLFPNTSAISLDAEGLTITTRESMPGVSGSTVPAVGAALLLPAVQAAREAARRAQCVNNLKQIGLAMHNHHDVNNGLPAAAITSKDGKPLLSWRVAILPYLEQQDLYNQFHLDEAWDSPHNKGLIVKMPKMYQCPSGLFVEPGTTTYRAFVGGGAPFDLKESVGFQKVTDGTSNTMAVAEAKTPVIWTKPDDMPFDPKAAASLLDCGSNHSGGFNVLFTDGSVRFIKMSVAVQTFRALITRDGGEVIAIDSF